MPPSTRSEASGRPGVLAGGVDEVGHLEGDALQRRPAQVRRRGAARQAEQHAACLRHPVRRPQADEARHEDHRLLRVRRRRQRLHRLGPVEELQPVAQPLHRRAGDEDAPFQGVLQRPSRVGGQGGQQPVLRQRSGGRPGAAGRTRRCRRCIWPRRPRSRTARTAPPADRPATPAIGSPSGRKPSPAVDAEVGGAGPHLRQQAARHVEEAAQFVVPLAGVQVQEQRARGVGGVGGVDPAAGQPIDKEAVDGAGGQLPRLGPAAQGGVLVEQPAQLGRGEVRIEDQAGALGEPRLRRPGAARQKSAVRRSCQTMARATGWPVARSQTTTVSRWLVTPMAARSRGSMPAAASACGDDRRRPSARFPRRSCSTQPGRG